MNSRTAKASDISSHRASCRISSHRPSSQARIPQLSQLEANNKHHHGKKEKTERPIQIEGGEGSSTTSVSRSWHGGHSDKTEPMRQYPRPAHLFWQAPLTTHREECSPKCSRSFRLVNKNNSEDCNNTLNNFKHYNNYNYNNSNKLGDSWQHRQQFQSEN